MSRWFENRGRRTALHLAFVLLFFAALTVLMTWPQAVTLQDGVRDPGDPLFNAWVLAWDVHQLRQGEIGDFFDANIFYPHRRTLAYSEHLFPQALVAAPVLAVSDNPILAHNVVLLLGIFTSALGMYFLARRLTGHTLGALVAGMLFAFSPFMISHLSHVQVLWAGGFPLTFLFLERLFEEARWRDALLLAAVASVQILANGYYALFLVFFAGLFVAIELVRRQQLRNRQLLGRLAVAGLVIAALTAPFLLQYVLVQEEMDFHRPIDYAADLENLLAAPPINRLYGQVTAPLLDHERSFFPTLTGAALAVVGGLALRRARRIDHRSGHRRELRLSARRMLNGLLVVVIVLLVLRRFDVSLDLKMHGNSSERLLAVLFYLVVASVLLRRWESGSRAGSPGSSFSTYLFLGGLALLFTFGKAGPYPLLHEHVPGFDGIRAIPRFYVVTSMVLAVLAARGLRWLMEERATPRQRAWLVGLVPLVLVAELASFPIPLTRIAVGDEVPEVYSWLATTGSPEDPVLEVPFGFDEFHRVYFSSRHWKPLVHGYSGYIPPLYDELKERWRHLSLEQNLADARALGVRYLVVHTHQPKPGGFVGLAEALDQMPAEAHLLRRFSDGVHVYDLWPGGAPSPSTMAERNLSLTAQQLSSLLSERPPHTPATGRKSPSRG